jgi:hypothetical protein
MAKRIRSAKGEMVDFDILTIKQQIAAGKSKAVVEPVVEVKRQENFIDKRNKRRIAKVVNKQPDDVTETEPTTE